MSFAHADYASPIKDKQYRAATELEHNKIYKAVVKYQKKVGRQKLMKKEIDRIVFEMGLSDINIISEDKFENDESINLVFWNDILRTSVDVDVVKVIYAISRDEPGFLEVLGGMKNCDTVDTHDYYHGWFDGYAEAAPGSGYMLQRVNHIYHEMNILPGTRRIDPAHMGFPVGCKAYFYIYINAFDEGTQIASKYRGLYNYKY